MQGVVQKGRNLVPFNNIDKNCFTVGTHTWWFLVLMILFCGGGFCFKHVADGTVLNGGEVLFDLL